MSWSLAFLILSMWISLLFILFIFYVYIKEYNREEQYLSKLENELLKPLPIVYLEKEPIKKQVIDNTTIKSKKNIN